MKAVIIDDEYWTRDSIKRLGDWERLGIDRVEEAEDGLSGLKIIGELRPEIVITDMKMRGMDGVELLRKLTDDYPFIRKIVISGYDDFAYTKQAIVSKVDEYVLKPVGAEDLNNALEKAVRELRNAQGLYAAGLLDRELLQAVTECKRRVAIHVQELQADAVSERFRELERRLSARQPLQPGVSNSLYKQFMLLLEEQASRLEAELNEALAEKTAALFVTDRTELRQWTGMLAEAYAAVIEQVAGRRRNKSRISIDAIRQYIDASFAEPITLESIAAAFFVSKEHLSRTFKQETGTTVTDYIIARRIDEAKRLLQDPSVSVKTAAQAVGYTDTAYFHRLFKKVTGSTPAELRP